MLIFLMLEEFEAVKIIIAWNKTPLSSEILNISSNNILLKYTLYVIPDKLSKSVPIPGYC